MTKIFLKNDVTESELARKIAALEFFWNTIGETSGIECNFCRVAD